MYTNDLLPHNLDAEEAVLGGVLLQPASIADIASLLAPQDFYRAQHGVIWQAMLDLYHTQRVPEQIVLAGQLKANGDWDTVGGMGTLATLIDQTPTSIHNIYWAHEIKEASRRRELIQIAGQIAAAAYDNQPVAETVNQGVSSLFRLNQANEQRRPVSATELYEEHSADLIAELDHGPEYVRGATTGFTTLDQAMHGWQKGLFYVVGARTSMGKTTFAASNMIKLAQQRRPVLCCTLETTRTQMMDRMVFGMAGVDAARYRSLPHDSWERDEQRERVLDALEEFDSLPLWITDQRGINPTGLRGIIHQHCETHGKPDLVMLDYLNLVGADGYSKDQYQRVSDTVRKLKDVGGEMDVPLVVMAQLSRAPEHRQDQGRRPSITDFRDSGAIEEVASTLMALYRDSYYYSEEEWERRNPGMRYPINEMDVLILKQQLGPTGTVKLRCDLSTGYMGDL